MKLSKQEILTAGVLFLIVIAIIIYTITAFGGKDDVHVRDEFEAPEIIRNEAREDYNARLMKELRHAPEQREEEALLNPFGDDEVAEEATEKVDSTDYMAMLFVPEDEKSEPETEPEPKKLIQTKPKRCVKPKTQLVTTVELKEEPEQEEPTSEIEEVQQEALIVKRRYSLQEKKGLRSINPNLKASVYGQQKIYNKSLLKMRLLSPLKLSDDVLIPRNTFIYAVAKFSNERVLLNVQSISYRNVIYPVQYTVCDANDGMEGIFVGGDVLNDLADETNTTLASEAISSTGIRVISDIGNEVKTWTKKKNIIILNEHNLFLK